jgi:UMF1 family MFS transporter
VNKKKIFVWALYDFANSIVMIAFFLYYSQWLVIDRGVSDFWFNISLMIASLVFLLVGPVLGSIADKTGNKVTGIRVTTIIAALLYFITGIITVSYPEHYIIATLLFMIALAVYLLSFIYYNSFLDDLAPKEKHGTVSGWGLVGNYLGQIAAILIALPFATGVITLWGSPGRAQAFIPATVIFFILALPMLIVFKKEKRNETVKINVADEYRGVWRGLVELIKMPGIGRFFLAYFFFNDAVLTAANNFPIYMEKVFGANDSVKSYIMLGILITSAIGSPLAGKIADKIGFNKTLSGILVGWIVIFPLLAFTHCLTFLVIITVIMGLLFGSVWTVTRAMVIRLTPKDSLNKSFTYFVLMERFATFIGPISWGLIVSFASPADSMNYRLAALAMTAFVVIGLVITRKLPKGV